MKRSPTFRSTKPGFTLVELLVAVAVLALVAMVLAQMLQTASQTWMTGQARVNNFNKGRSMLDLLVRDLQGGVYRDDLPAFPNNEIAFYTGRPGFSGNTTATRNLSWVQYDLGTTSNTILQRSDLAVDWQATNAVAFGSTMAPTGATPRDTAPGVVGFQIQFLYADGSISTNYHATNRPRAVSIGLAVIDDKTLERLQADPLKITALRNGFASRATGTNSVKADWENYLKDGMNWDSYPPSLATGLKVFERYVSLP